MGVWAMGLDALREVKTITLYPPAGNLGIAV
jgi:hypothetical protein